MRRRNRTRYCFNCQSELHPRYKGRQAIFCSNGGYCRKEFWRKVEEGLLPKPVNPDLYAEENVNIYMSSTKE